MDISLIGKQMRTAEVRRIFLTLLVASLAGFGVYCGNAGKLGIVQSEDICNCLPLAPDISDFRHLAKHVPIPNDTPQEISVETILGWPQDVALPTDAPRSGRELQVFHVAQAFLQNASLNNGDCDIHLEISANADKNAPRVIVETPVDTEFCAARHSIQSQLKQHGFVLDAQHGGELPQALAADVVGLAFEDFPQPAWLGRGSNRVGTASRHRDPALSVGRWRNADLGRVAL